MTIETARPASLEFVCIFGQDALDEVRRGEYKRLSGKDRSYIKGQRYTLLSRRENLSLDGRRALKKLLQANRRRPRRFNPLPPPKRGETRTNGIGMSMSMSMSFNPLPPPKRGETTHHVDVGRKRSLVSIPSCAKTRPFLT